MDTVAVFKSPSPQRCAEFALVLIAMGIGCRLAKRGDEYRLEVDAADADRARDQIYLYVRENEHPSRVFNPVPKVRDGLTCATLYAVVLLLVDVLQRDRLFSIDWLQAGAAQAAAIQGGEWWRAVTALSLHVDSPHLVGNLFFGMLFIYLAGEFLGWGLALSGVVLGGALGNLLNAFAQAPSHTSIGASTALFAAVGLLAAYTWSLRARRLNRWVPLGAAVAVLAFIGMGGERTDIFAHFAGLAAGSLFGFVYGALEARAILTDRFKRYVGFGAAAFFFLGWGLALGS